MMNKNKIRAAEDWNSESSSMINQGYKIITWNGIKYWVLKDDTK